MATPATGGPSNRLRISDVRGVAQLATQATVGVTRIVEGVHRSVLDTLGIPGGNEVGRTRGITGLVYRSIYGVTRLVGGGLDALLSRLQPLSEPTGDADPGTPAREALIAALNGVMGDRLVATNNPFAIPMALRCESRALDWQHMPPMPEATGKVSVLIHGLCVNDLQRHAQQRGHVIDHGEVLASSLGYTPVHVRYNSGLHTSQNGRELSAQLEQLVAHWPAPIEDLSVVAHSMGGLLIRSALHYAKEEALHWPGHLKNIVFLGTPHHGAPLERVGNWVDVILGSTPYTRPFSMLGQLRSPGITDLRHGHVLDEDWQGHDRFHRRADDRQVVPLPEGVTCCAIAATMATRRSALADRLIGDGLVPLRSAMGQHDDAKRNLGIAPESRWIAYRTNHMELLSSPDVARQIVRWLTTPES